MKYNGGQPAIRETGRYWKVNRLKTAFFALDAGLFHKIARLFLVLLLAGNSGKKGGLLERKEKMVKKVTKRIVLGNFYYVCWVHITF